MSSRAPIHSVHIYNEDTALISRLCAIVASSLKLGDAVLIVATEPHRNELVRELRKSGVDVRSHARSSLFTMVDAEEALAAFMRDGMPDPELFSAVIGDMLAQAQRASRRATRGVTVFGEMVAVLWKQDKKAAALQLEAMWNDALNQSNFRLHCAYPRQSLLRGDEVLICGLHSHLIAA